MPCSRSRRAEQPPVGARRCQVILSDNSLGVPVMKGARAGLRRSMAGIAPEPMKDRVVFPELVLAKGICKTAKKPANRCERVLFLDPSDAVTEVGKSLDANEPGAQPTATAPTL